MKSYCIIILLLSLLCLGGCAAHSNLFPVGKGNLKANLGAGGPFISVSDLKIPTPYLTLGADYGLSDNLNCDATVHLTSLFFKVAGLDLGATWFPVINNKLIPSWGIQPRVMILSSLKTDVQTNFKVYPILSSSAAWDLGNGLIYTGFDFIMPLARPDYDNETPNTIISPFAGYSFRLGKQTSLQAELKWHGANVQGNQLAAGYISPGGYGAVSAMFSISRSF
ncbi:MAG: hypothetical protein ACM34K_10115 [Bacillota bacterium]